MRVARTRFQSEVRVNHAPQPTTQDNSQSSHTAGTAPTPARMSLPRGSGVSRTSSRRSGGFGRPAGGRLEGGMDRGARGGMAAFHYV